MNPVKSVTDRTQRIAFFGSISGLALNTILFAIYVIGGELDANLVINNMVYNIVLVSIIWCTLKNYRIKSITLAGILVIYGHIWATSFADAFNDELTVISLPLLLFAPIILILIAGWRTLAIIALVQAVLVYKFTQLFGASLYGTDWTAQEHASYSSAKAVLSLMTVGLLAIIAYARERTDCRLMAVIREKERLAAEDPLTGLVNRRSFLERLEQNWATRIPLVCAFIDLDRFKPLNDEYGHAIGDFVLETIGERLSNMDGVLMAARFGGDEFAVLVERNIISEQVEPYFLNMHRKLCADIITDAGCVGVGASIGYAEAPDDAGDVSSLLHAADVAMLRVKENGGGATRFDQMVDSHTLASSAMEATFRSALQSGKIRPALQPIADAKTGQVIGHELLARWVDSGFEKDPSPADFIPIAERLGLLNDVLATTLEEIFAAGVKSHLFLSVNVSPSQLSNPNFFVPLLRVLGKYGVSTDHLELEVTEQVAFRNNEHNITMLQKARDLGFTVALDDFGTGYSSLAMLDQLPLNKLKIDRSFIRNGAKSANDDVLSATINLAKKLGLTCCIEGVEDEETALHMRDLGCEQMQGYWIGKPYLIEGGRAPLTEPETPLQIAGNPRGRSLVSGQAPYFSSSSGSR